MQPHLLKQGVGFSTFRLSEMPNMGFLVYCLCRPSLPTGGF
ncbi:hypothetical protein AcetOrient_orf00151 [Acetobacter orientalis]|uniref:Uncharacterized protein n=1 Tax=Acetobacter orientalis TaxID=146474 RepID=A0A2Z5ZDA3_9PROT|nr:hypothetical protein AcetOrient_orf00151 [Acetobacter orientalis]